MERKGVPALTFGRRKSVWRLAIVLIYFFLFVRAGSAQNAVVLSGGWSWSSWHDNPGFFLEPNRFSIAKELGDRSLWFQMGFGKPIFSYGGLQIGLEGLAWSRLQALSQFRFPVETVDYFFGAFFTWVQSPDVGWKLRISHISSHLVDGADSITGGSSSKYSREFVELTRTNPWNGHEEFLWSVGVRVYFHQVTKIEPWIAVPACLTWRFVSVHSENGTLFSEPRKSDSCNPGIIDYNYYLFVSSGDGPISTSIAGGLRAERTIGEMSALDLQLYYYYGASWAGTDAGTKRSTINLQMDVRGF